MTLRRQVRAAVAAATLLALAGCGSLSPTQAGAPEAAKHPDHLSLSNFAVSVLGATVAARSVHAERVEVTGGARTEMTGDTWFDQASYRGRLTLVTVPRSSRSSASVEKGELRLVSGHVYVHVPGVVPVGTFLSQDLSTMTPSAGGLCACLFSHLEPSETLSNMRQSLTKVGYLGSEKQGGLTLARYRLEADTSRIPGAVDSAHPPTTRVYLVWLDAKHLPRRMKYLTVDKAVDVTYRGWGERVDVRPPAPRQIVSVPGSGATGA